MSDGLATDYYQRSWTAYESSQLSKKEAVVQYGALFVVLGSMIVGLWALDAYLGFFSWALLGMVVAFVLSCGLVFVYLWVQIHRGNKGKLHQYVLNNRGLVNEGKLYSFSEMDQVLTRALVVEKKKVFEEESENDLGLFRFDLPLKRGKLKLLFEKKNTYKKVLQSIGYYLKETDE